MSGEYLGSSFWGFFDDAIICWLIGQFGGFFNDVWTIIEEYLMLYLADYLFVF